MNRYDTQTKSKQDSLRYNLTKWMFLWALFSMFSTRFTGSAIAKPDEVGPTLLPFTEVAHDPRLHEFARKHFIFPVGLKSPTEVAAFLDAFEKFKDSNLWARNRFYIAETRKMIPDYIVEIDVSDFESTHADSILADLTNVPRFCAVARMSARLKQLGIEKHTSVNEALAPAALRPSTLEILNKVLEDDSQTAELLIDTLSLNNFQLAKFYDRFAPVETNYLLSKYDREYIAAHKIPFIPHFYTEQKEYGNYFFLLRRTLEVHEILVRKNIQKFEIHQDFINSLSSAEFKAFKSELPDLIPTLSTEDKQIVDAKITIYSGEQLNFMTNASLSEFSVISANLEQLRSGIQTLKKPLDNLRVYVAEWIDGRHKIRTGVLLADLLNLQKETKEFDSYLASQGFHFTQSFFDMNELINARKQFEEFKQTLRFKKLTLQIQETRNAQSQNKGGDHKPSIALQMSDGKLQLVRLSLIIDISQRFDLYNTFFQRENNSSVNLEFVQAQGASLEVSELIAAAIESDKFNRSTLFNDKSYFTYAVMIPKYFADALLQNNSELIKTLNNSYYNLPAALRDENTARINLDTEHLLSMNVFAFNRDYVSEFSDFHPHLRRLAATWGRLRYFEADRLRIDQKFLVKLNREEFDRFNSVLIPKLQELAKNSHKVDFIEIVFGQGKPKKITSEEGTVYYVPAQSLADLYK